MTVAMQHLAFVMCHLSSVTHMYCGKAAAAGIFFSEGMITTPIHTLYPKFLISGKAARPYWKVAKCRHCIPDRIKKFGHSGHAGLRAPNVFMGVFYLPKPSSLCEILPGLVPDCYSRKPISDDVNINSY